MKTFYSLLSAAVLWSVGAQAQPAGYYNAAYGYTGESLRAALYNIIKGHTVLTYTPGLWDAYATTDVKANGKLATVYSDKPGSTPPYEFTIGTDQCGSSTPGTEGVCYNREHIWPQSKFGKAAPMLTDLWVAYPTDSKVNSQRADWPYGKVTTASWTSQNGSKLGAQAYPGAPSGTAFEPIDSFKGDIARSYFYITTRYYGDSSSFIAWDMATNSRLKPWAIQMLLEWNRLDPISAKEKSRNEAAYALQGNRNPFIDDPRFAECIWAGNCAGLTVPTVHSVRLSVTPNPAVSSVSIDWQMLSPDEVLAVDITDMQGRLVYHVAQPTQALRIAVDTWAKGCYILQLRTRHDVRNEKLMLQ